MTHTILLTSFQTWMLNQRSNASDDLVERLLADSTWACSHTIHALRQLPVDFQHAPIQVMTHIQTIQPDLILLCGMAASRKLLNLEQRAIAGDKVRTTSLNLRQVRKGLRSTRVSQNAGRFVCNGLYYAVLSYLQAQEIPIPCLFVHVPVLTPVNTTSILQDFQTMCDRIIADLPAPKTCLSLSQHDTITL